MDVPTWKKFIDVIAFVLVFVIPLILYLMEKAGESLVKIFAFGWISVAAAAIYLVLNIPWVWEDPQFAVRLWRLFFLVMQRCSRSLSGYGSVAAAAVYLVLNIPWVWEDPQFAVRLWRLFFVCSVAVLVVGYMALQIWPTHGEDATSKADSSTVPINGINVDFGAFFLNMSQNLNSLGWWGIYNSGATISPISLVMRVTLTNIGEKPENVGHYSLAVKTQECGSIYLTPIDPRAVPRLAVVSKSLGFNKVPIFNFVDDSLIKLLKKPLLPHIPVQGWLLFGYSNNLFHIQRKYCFLSARVAKHFWRYFVLKVIRKQGFVR